MEDMGEGKMTVNTRQVESIIVIVSTADTGDFCSYENVFVPPTPAIIYEPPAM